MRRRMRTTIVLIYWLYLPFVYLSSLFLCSPWVDKYEEAYENHYSADLLALLAATRINGVHVSTHHYKLVQL